MRTCLKALVEAGQLDQPGLLIERFFPIGDKNEDEKARFRYRVASAGAPEAYRSAYTRWNQALAEASFWTFEATLKTRLTIGLGVANPSENGIALQRTFGVPVIPGSTIKGALRSCAFELCGLHDNVKPQWKREEAPVAARPALEVFGAADAMAAVTCFDAWWVPTGKPFCVETWTPHHQKYMTQGADLPLESDDPNPIGLFAVPKGAKFRFAFQVPDPQAEWIAALADVVRLALERGLGAKHSQGYGRFTVPELVPGGPVRDDRGQRPQEVVVLTDGQHHVAGMFRVRGKSREVEFPGGQTRPVLDPPNLEDGTPVTVRVNVTKGQIQREIQGKNVRPR
ncbi:MAG: type III-B CRISPR module RAMP protein Cmr6 [Fimbriimonadaceae bacterium]|nr:type III-B CRISPR module RAMP protein Cmr6 [Fimbriimonadaceae bacterium]